MVVGKEVGAGHHMKGYQYVKGFALLCPAITFCICAIGLTFNAPLLRLFGLGAEAMFYGKYMIMIYLAAGTIRTCNYIMNSCYRRGRGIHFRNRAGNRMSFYHQCACDMDCRYGAASAFPGSVRFPVYG